MRNTAMLAASLFTVMLAACGSSEPEPVVEQIVIREPGAPDASAKATGEGAPLDRPLDRVALGERAFQVCTGCHVAEKGGRSMAGPNLYGVVGRKAATLDDFYYSDALSGSDITWDYASLDRFLANPSGYVEGTSMVAGAVRDAQTRAAIVAYLASQSD